jgi:hypothetical protein
VALTLSKKKVWVDGDRKEVIFDATFDASYPTGGLALDTTVATGIGLEIEVTHIDGGVSNNGLIVNYDAAAGKLKAFWSSAAGSVPSEVTNATNLSTHTVRLRAVGKGGAAA